MSLIQRNFTQIWDQLRAKKPQLKQFLESVTIKQLRGMGDLSINLTYPVTVIAGANGCGKSTLLMACACAYQDPQPMQSYTPAQLFPDLKAKHYPQLSDPQTTTQIDYHFIEHDRLGMSWRRLKSWSRSFMGRKNATQPIRPLYLRTLAHLNNPSELRSLLSIGSQKGQYSELNADSIAFAHRVLPFKYRGITQLSLKNRDLLVASREESSIQYSEFHMSAGERALLRLSKEISQLNGALILIDEIEAGLHPYTQQQVMLELQRLALRNDLQILITSHSAVVLESVPPEGRIFLERTVDRVVVQPAWRDIFQRAFYGRAQDQLSILCEDSIAEALILGVLDHLNPQLNLAHDAITVGRDTGKDQFAHHVDALGKFRLLDQFLFVLDGDAREVEPAIAEAAKRYNRMVTPLYLPGTVPPEGWIYTTLEQQIERYSQDLAAPSLATLLAHLRQQFDNAADRPTAILKARFATLAESLQQTPEMIARRVGLLEAGRGELKPFTDDLHQAILNWRNQS